MITILVDNSNQYSHMTCSLSMIMDLVKLTSSASSTAKAGKLITLSTDAAISYKKIDHVENLRNVFFYLEQISKQTNTQLKKEKSF